MKTKVDSRDIIFSNNNEGLDSWFNGLRPLSTVTKELDSVFTTHIKEQARPVILIPGDLAPSHAFVDIYINMVHIDLFRPTQYTYYNKQNECLKD